MSLPGTDPILSKWPNGTGHLTSRISSSVKKQIKPKESLFPSSKPQAILQEIKYALLTIIIKPQQTADLTSVISWGTQSFSVFYTQLQITTAKWVKQMQCSCIILKSCRVSVVFRFVLFYRTVKLMNIQTTSFSIHILFHWRLGSTLNLIRFSPSFSCTSVSEIAVADSTFHCLVLCQNFPQRWGESYFYNSYQHDHDINYSKAQEIQPSTARER